MDINLIIRIYLGQLLKLLVKTPTHTETLILYQR